MQRDDSPEEGDFTTELELAGLIEGLASIGHAAVPIDLSEPLPEIARRAEEHRIDVILNTLELVRGELRPAGVVPTVARLLRIPCTGGDARSIAVGADKWLTKRVVPSGTVRFPADAFLCDGQHWGDMPYDGAFPVIAKPNFGGSSQGIGSHSIAATPAGVDAVLDRLAVFRRAGVIVEEFIPGTDITVGCLEQDGRWRVLAPVVYDIPEVAGRRVLTRELKTYEGWVGVSARPAELSRQGHRELERFALELARGVGAAGSARVDLRLSEKDGLLYALEVNVIAALDPDAGLALSAAYAGTTHGELLAHLLATAR
jgi:D-alanine-D-alanine ligase